MIIFLKRSFRSDIFEDYVTMNMSAPMDGAGYDIRCLDPTWTLGIKKMQELCYHNGEDNVEFDNWYRQYIESNPQLMTALAFIFNQLFNNKIVVIFVGSQPYDDMITESFIKYLTTVYGLSPLFIENYYADVEEEVELIDLDTFDDFSEYGIEVAKSIVDTYCPNLGVMCTPQEVDSYGLRDAEYESLY